MLTCCLQSLTFTTLEGMHRKPATDGMCVYVWGTQNVGDAQRPLREIHIWGIPSGSCVDFLIQSTKCLVGSMFLWDVLSPDSCFPWPSILLSQAAHPVLWMKQERSTLLGSFPSSWEIHALTCMFSLSIEGELMGLEGLPWSWAEILLLPFLIFFVVVVPLICWKFSWTPRLRQNYSDLWVFIKISIWGRKTADSYTTILLMYSWIDYILNNSYITWQHIYI